MPAILQLVTRLPHTTGLPGDVTENVINIGFAGADPATIEITAATNDMVEFWTTDPGPQTAIIGTYISPSVSRAANACSVTAYLTNDLTGVTDMGSPVNSQTFTINTAGAPDQPFPEEVAVAISYHGDLTDVPQQIPNPAFPPDLPQFFRPAQRRRGRMFIGPLCLNSATDTGDQSRPSSTFRTDLGIAFANLCQIVALDTTGDVSVWSKADADFYPIVAGYVDDAWDTQRRRGLEATVRTPFTV